MVLLSMLGICRNKIEHFFTHSYRIPIYPYTLVSSFHHRFKIWLLRLKACKNVCIIIVEKTIEICVRRINLVKRKTIYEKCKMSLNKRLLNVITKNTVVKTKNNETDTARRYSFVCKYQIDFGSDFFFQLGGYNTLYLSLWFTSISPGGS